MSLALCFNHHLELSIANLLKFNLKEHFIRDQEWYLIVLKFLLSEHRLSLNELQDLKVKMDES